jgi:hypothetical protein
MDVGEARRKPGALRQCGSGSAECAPRVLSAECAPRVLSTENRARYHRVHLATARVRAQPTLRECCSTSRLEATSLRRSRIRNPNGLGIRTTRNPRSSPLRPARRRNVDRFRVRRKRIRSKCGADQGHRRRRLVGIPLIVRSAQLRPPLSRLVQFQLRCSNPSALSRRVPTGWPRRSWPAPRFRFDRWRV